jgi:holo-[acyl-carrier protein] synthase
MITGIGLDLIEVSRVVKACEKETFLRRCFTADEIDFFNNDFKRAADNFAVKEAVAKMFGTGFRGIALIEIEVLRDQNGKPYVKLYGKAEELASTQGITAIHVSISNTKDYANAFAVGEV